jgi:RNA polymerase sigma factor (sigma-70 family)
MTPWALPSTAKGSPGCLWIALRIRRSFASGSSFPLSAREFALQMRLFRVLESDSSDDFVTHDAIDRRASLFQTQGGADDALLAEAAKLEPEAFGELYERYYTRVYRYVYHRVGAAADAEDITALVFMKALEALPSYQVKRSSFAPWLFRITRNAVVDHYRRGRKQTSLDDVAQEAVGADPVLAVLNNERRHSLNSLVERLSPEQREVILMRYAADLSFSEIAATLKKNEPAIRMLLHRGLRKLKAVMEGEEPRP